MVDPLLVAAVVFMPCLIHPCWLVIARYEAICFLFAAKSEIASYLAMTGKLMSLRTDAVLEINLARQPCFVGTGFLLSLRHGMLEEARGYWLVA